MRSPICNTHDTWIVHLRTLKNGTTSENQRKLIKVNTRQDKYWSAHRYTIIGDYNRT